MGVSRQTIGSLENGRYNPSIVLAFKSRGEGRQNLMVACAICSAVGIFLGNWLIGLVATGFAGVGVYLAMRGPKNYSSGPI